MQAIFPGRPQATLQAIDTASWAGRRVIIYIAGNSVIVLGGPSLLIQAIYLDEDDRFHAVALDCNTGKIAAAHSQEVEIYKPYGEDEGALKWALESTISISEDVPNHRKPTVLSWASDGELLVAGTSLRLYQTNADNRLIWDRRVPNATKLASFSHDTSTLASTGYHDRLVKLWKRQAFGPDDTRCDFIFLPHPTTVTAIHWGRSRRHERHTDNVFFTVCADGKIRVWATAESHMAHGIQAWATIDMRECIKPRSGLESASSQRCVFFVDSTDFTEACDVALKDRRSSFEIDDHTLEHFREVAKNCPEVCVIIDQHGHMSAWGLENTGHHERRPTDVFNIAHVEDFELPFMTPAESDRDGVHFLTFSTHGSHCAFVILAHLVDGRIFWVEGALHQMLSPSPHQERYSVKCIWTGHGDTVTGLSFNHSTDVLISRTEAKETLVWRQVRGPECSTLERKSSIDGLEHVYAAINLKCGALVVAVQRSAIYVLDTTGATARQIADSPFRCDGIPLRLIEVADVLDKDTSIVTLLTSKSEHLSWAICKVSGDRAGQDCIQRFDRGALDEVQALVCAQALAQPWNKESADVASHLTPRDMYMTCDEAGTVSLWSAIFDMDEGSIEWQTTSILQTRIQQPALAEISSSNKTAIIDSSMSSLTIWDQLHGLLEHEALFPSHDDVRELRWSQSETAPPILAVAFSYKIILLAPKRFTMSTTDPAWLSIQQYDTRELTSHPISAIEWLGGGNLVAGAGSQLYVFDKKFDASYAVMQQIQVPKDAEIKPDLLDLVSFVNQSLPIYHPAVLRQYMLAGQVDQVHRILLALQGATKFFSDGDSFDKWLKLPASTLWTSDKQTDTDTRTIGNGDLPSSASDDTTALSLDEGLASSLVDNLSKVHLPDIDGISQTELLNLIACVGSIERLRHSLDVPATSFLFAMLEASRLSAQVTSTSSNSNWRDIVLASNSGKQDILVDQMTRHFQGRILWQQARQCGIFMWLSDVEAVRAQFEIVARNEYTKTDEKNPIDCSLFYLALRKKNILLGLWRMAGWHREQAGTQRLLKNDFAEARWKTAALKNAYALLSKRRFEYAAAFFVLAGNLQDAVNVCAHQLDDLQLAITIARVYDGDESPALKTLLKDVVLPKAVQEGDRWLAKWAFGMLGQRDMAIRSLYLPLSALVPTANKPPSAARSYLNNDPTLARFYDYVRHQTVHGSKPMSAFSVQEEWGFVLQASRVYCRMGCNLLALDLVSNWKFSQQVPVRKPAASPESSSSSTASSAIGAIRESESARIQSHGKQDESHEDESESIHSGNDSDESVISDEKAGKPEVDVKDEKKAEKRAPTQFVEPDAGSLLDSFGF